MNPYVNDPGQRHTLRDLRQYYPAERYQTLAAKIAADPAISNRMVDAIHCFDDADPVDALADAVLLAELMAMRVAEQRG